MILHPSICSKVNLIIFGVDTRQLISLVSSSGMDNLAVEITDGTERVGSEEPLVNQTTNEDRAIILEEIVRDVLDTRPAILAAKPRPQTPPEPSSLTRRMTMPDRIREGSSKGHRKSSSIHGLGKDLQSMDCKEMFIFYCLSVFSFYF